MRHHLAYGLPIEELDVVLVDDHRGTQAMLRSMLSAFRVARIRTFDNVQDALRAMTVEPPSVVLTDWEMRPLNGLTMLRLMRRADADPLCFVPVIMVTGHASLGIIEKAFKSGMHHVLAKPISPAALLERLSWLTRDNRPMVQQDGTWHIDGLEEIVEKRIEPLRRNGVLRQASSPKMVEAKPTVPAMADASDLELEEVAAAAPARIRRPTTRRQPSWRGWRL